MKGVTSRFPACTCEKQIFKFVCNQQRPGASPPALKIHFKDHLPSGWVAGKTSLSNQVSIHTHQRERHRERDRERQRETERERETETERERQRERERERERERQRQRETQRERQTDRQTDREESFIDVYHEPHT